MKILLAHNFYRYKGGEDTYFFSLKKLLEKYGHTVLEFTKDNKNISDTITSKLEVAGKLFFNPDAQSELTSLIQSERPDIVHFNNIFPLITPTTYQVCHDNNIPTVQTMHNYRLLCPKGTLFRNGKVCTLCIDKLYPLYAMIYKCYQDSYPASVALSSSIFFHKLSKTFNNIDLFLFPSEFSKNLHINNSDIFKDKSVILPYFIENNLFSYKKSDYFLYAGRLSEEKGIEQLLQVFSTLSSKYKLVVLGDGPLKLRLKHYKNKSNIKIISSPSQKDIYKFMSEALCTIIPSLWYETGPIVMIESFSAGTPVIVPESIVFKKTVTQNKTGYFYDMNDLGSLKKVIMDVYEQKNKTLQLNISARQVYEKYYTPEAHYKSLLKYYLKVKKSSS